MAAECSPGRKPGVQSHENFLQALEEGDRRSETEATPKFLSPLTGL
jgi:hypothetical protein